MGKGYHFWGHLEIPLTQSQPGCNALMRSGQHSTGYRPKAEPPPLLKTGHGLENR